MGILQALDKIGQSTLDHLLQCLGGRAVKDGAKGHGGGVTEAPFGVGDVGDDELDGEGEDLFWRYVCVCVCVRERERERKEEVGIWRCVCLCVYLFL